jgi:hypothetical protein
MWKLLQPMQGSQRLGFEIGRAGHAGPADAIVRDVLPPPSSGFSSGAYPGRKNKRNRPLVDAANASTALERCTG